MTAFARLALSPLLDADAVADVIAETQLAASLEVRRYIGTETGAEAAARDARLARDSAAAIAPIHSEARGDAERPAYRGPRQALRALDAARIDGPPLPPSPVWDLLVDAQHATPRTESAISVATRVVDVERAWEACLVDGWVLVTAPFREALSAPQARAVVVWATLGLPGDVAPAQDPVPLHGEGVRQKQPRGRLAVRGHYDEGVRGGFDRHHEPEAHEVAEYASRVFEVTVPTGHVVRMRAAGVLALYGQLRSRGLVPLDRRLATMADTTEATGLERLDLCGWKDIRPLFQKPGSTEPWDERTLRSWAERAEDPLPLHTVGGQVAASRADLAAWSAREYERTRRKPRAATR